MSLLRSQRYLQTSEYQLLVSGCHLLPCSCSTSEDSWWKAGCGSLASLNWCKQRVAWGWGSEQGFWDTGALGQVPESCPWASQTWPRVSILTTPAATGEMRNSEGLPFLAILVLLYPCVQKTSRESNIASFCMSLHMEGGQWGTSPGVPGS